ncbi:hypothetical protein ACJIZ3_006685 [Penstemon smallii]|uniref:RIN4 pathogenic type III effector avirulence factor Avr cleavage site domain-containing protein n=1 Tax=Penstemon smallii TaxID=265156 RepID=A0ABD3S8P0_9LAMI
MAQRSHVPKFGNWDGDNVPYTAYFENARKEKTNGILINPNDPEENPEAFNFGNSNVSPVDSEKYVVHRRNTSDQQKSYKSVASEYSSSDKSPSDNSTSVLNKPKHLHKRSERKKYSTGSSIPPSPGPNYRMNYTDDVSCRSVSVPKFGEWDEKDPRSAEGFTVIFNKVKEEKQIAAAKFSPMTCQNINNYQTSPKQKTRSKKCCGLF